MNGSTSDSPQRPLARCENALEVSKALSRDVVGMIDAISAGNPETRQQP